MKRIILLIAVIAALMPAGAGICFSGGVSGDVHIVEDVRDGMVAYRSDRWKTWFARSGAICAANLLLLTLLWFIPKKTEPDIIFSYVISGITFVLAIWVCLSGMLLARWKILPSAAAFIAGGALTWTCWKMLGMIKGLDEIITTAGQAAVLRNLEKSPKEDTRLAAVSGACGEWPDMDIWRNTGRKTSA